MIELVGNKWIALFLDLAKAFDTVLLCVPFGFER